LNAQRCELLDDEERSSMIRRLEEVSRTLLLMSAERT
jgi:hypothetical protein